MENASDTLMKTSQRKLVTAKLSLIGVLARHSHRMIIGIPKTKSDKAIVDVVFGIVSTNRRMNVVTEKLCASVITFLRDGSGTICLL